MLDLECTDPEAHNPLILELAAVHFDLDTGDVFDAFTRIINYDSCTSRGLDAEDPETLELLNDNENLKRTLGLSKSSTISLENALSDFSEFIDKTKNITLQKHPRSGA